MNKKYYFVEIASFKHFIWYNVELLDFSKLQDYFINSIMDYERTKMYNIWSKIKFNGEKEVQYLMISELKTHYGRQNGSIYIVYAETEEKALEKVL